jgi:sugar phosphate isomerase/epimerase
MYKNFNAESLGISGRQNELIELTLTYKFRSLDVNIQELMRQIASRGLEHATRFLQSANLRVGSFELPVQLAGATDAFDNDLEALSEFATVAASLGASRCIANLLPYCLNRPYHENFELHRQRIGKVAALLGAQEIQLGLGFIAPKAAREPGNSQFIATPDALLTLIHTIDQPVGLCLDTWHWYVAGGKVEQLKDFPIDKLVMVRLADVPPDADLASITEEQRLLPGSTGVVPNVAWLRWLAARDYRGPLTPFCHPSQFAGVTRTQSVGQAADALTVLLQAAQGGEVSAVKEQAATIRT